MKFELESNLRGATDEELLDELIRCAESIGRKTVTIAEFEEHGKCHPSTIQRRFGSWVKALELAGLSPSRSKIGITQNELFENLKSVWISLGRQPRYHEIRSPFSQYPVGTYEKRFGSWSKALKAFVDWVNDDDSEIKTQRNENYSMKKNTLQIKKRTLRTITERQRFRILLRDGFRCKACGASPLDRQGIELHVDHIVPWSKGGETIDENLECKCSRCNLGKGNAFNI